MAAMTITIDTTNAITRFITGPATATIILPVLTEKRRVRFAGLYCTGRPQASSGTEEIAMIIGIKMVPMGSIWCCGAKVRRPCKRGVGSPKRFAIQAWPNSWTAMLRMKAIR